jgi:hypothetical protein
MATGSAFKLCCFKQINEWMWIITKIGTHYYIFELYRSFVTTSQFHIYFYFLSYFVKHLMLRTKVKRKLKIGVNMKNTILLGCYTLYFGKVHWLCGGIYCRKQQICCYIAWLFSDMATELVRSSKPNWTYTTLHATQCYIPEHSTLHPV